MAWWMRAVTALRARSLSSPSRRLRPPRPRARLSSPMSASRSAVGASGPFEVVADGGVVDVLVELGQPGLVGGAGLVVEDRVGSGGGDQPGELRGGDRFPGPR